MKTRTVVITCICTAAVLIGAALIYAGRVTGDKLGDVISDRLTLLWPDMMALPEPDRALLVMLSLECNMYAVPAEPAAVRGCLAAAAAKDESKMNNAEQNLARLFKMASPAN
ncbi:hypothetical protein [Polaromonas sp.]|uniref:hypothetical protein n=1 Tax=Polaromonas sp. TaxID=1869339 RepID=UPI00352B57A9